MHSEFIRERKGRTAVLFIHGILGTPRHFDEFIPLVPADWSVYNILLDGHGGRVEDLSRTSMKKWRRQVERIASRLAARYDNIIITAHSMGALFAAEQALKRPQIKLLCLLTVPLSIALKPVAVTNSAKVIFDRLRPDDLPAVTARRKYSIKADRRLWKYLGWLPRYLELFELSAKSRELFKRLRVPCYIFQSARDELVSMRSLRYLKRCPTARIKILPRSGHFYYEARDNAEMLKYYSRLMRAAHRRLR